MARARGPPRVAGRDADLSPLRLRFLGSGDAFGSGGRLQTCMALEGGGETLLIDCGATSLIALKRAGVAPNDVGAVLVTHLHGDHFGGVQFLVLDGQFARRTRPLTVAGPPGVGARVEAAMEVLFPGSTKVERRFDVRFVELAPREATVVGAARVTAFPVVHPSGAPPYALRVEAGGRVVAYSGDTEWTDALVEVARGADLFVCEAYTFERKVKYHLDWATLAAQRGRLDCRRLIVTHMSPDMLAHLDGVDVEGASDGMVVDLSFA